MPEVYEKALKSFVEYRNLNGLSFAILILLTFLDNLTVKQIARELKYSETSIRRTIAWLILEKLIIEVGSTPPIKYTLVKI